MRTTIILFCTMLLGVQLAAQNPQNKYFEIQNDYFWNTADGKPMYTQGGGIFRFADPETGELTYFWYGNHYKEAELYRGNPRKKYPNCTFVSVSCYSSKDMVNWHEEADVLTAEEANGGRRRGGWLGRLGVGYLKEINKYVLLMQQNNSEEDQQHVIGKMSLLVTDDADFVREISQEIASEPYIPLNEGKYMLQFKMKNASKLKKATVSVVSGGKTFTKKLNTAAHEWQGESFEVDVKNGKAILTFHIEGKAKAECRIDDILLTMLK